MALKSIIPALIMPSRWVWPASAVVIVFLVAGFLTVTWIPSANAAPESNPPLDCLSCHKKTLKGHDKLGEGNEACWACHYSMEMGVLHLADETQLQLSDSTQLCAQCHQERYNAWKEGTHGIPAWKEGVPAITDKAQCADCHDPHQPQIVLLNITEPHPPPTPPAPPLPTGLSIMFGISLLLALAIVAAVARKGEQT